MKAIKSDFISKGVRCDGDLLLPDGATRPPVVIMGHGVGAQKDFRLMAYAERFVQKNMAVFLFDYRTFGKSDGSPRQIISLSSCARRPVSIPLLIYRCSSMPTCPDTHIVLPSIMTKPSAGVSSSASK